MKNLICFLILKLVSSSYDDLVSAEASKLNVVFEVDLIHRDSPLSPHYNSSMTALERLKRRFMGSKERDDVVEADVIPSNGEYLIKIGIGSPAVEFTAIADTGSDLIWLQCSPCLNCEPQPAPLFDPTKSSTYKAIPCASESCVHSTGCSIKDTNQTGSCVYFQGYADGSNSTGILSTDTITFPSSATAEASLALPLSVFGCGYKQHGSLFDGEGIIGLGGGPLSLVSQLGERINYKFSYCLAPLDISGSGATSKMRFGADLTVTEVVSTPLVIKESPTFYFLQLDGISIGDSLVTVGKGVIIDSGTPLTWLETEIYNGVKDAVTRAIGMSPVPDPSLGMELCFETLEIGNPPDVVFHFKGADVVLKSANTHFQFGNVTCFTFMPEDANETMIFGNYAQINFQVGYDLQAKQVSFAPTDCTNF